MSYRERVIADLEHLTEHAEVAKAAVDGTYVQGYLDGLRHALESVRGIADTPAEAPTARVLAERADGQPFRGALPEDLHDKRRRT